MADSPPRAILARFPPSPTQVQARQLKDPEFFDPEPSNLTRAAAVGGRWPRQARQEPNASRQGRMP